MEGRFGGFDADVVEEDSVVVCLFFPLPLLALAFGAVDGPALEEGVRLGGLKGSLRLFCAGGSPVILMRRAGKCDVETETSALIKLPRSTPAARIAISRRGIR